MKNLRFRTYVCFGILAVAGSMLFAANSYGHNFTEVSCPDLAKPTAARRTNINGLALIDHTNGVTRILAVIDFFGGSDSVIAELTIDKDGKAVCKSLQIVTDKSFEAVTAFPEDKTRFLAIEQGGEIFDIKYANGKIVSFKPLLTVPVIPGADYEGLAVQKIGTEWVIVWVNRILSPQIGARLYFATFNDPTDIKIDRDTKVQYSDIFVSYPTVPSGKEIKEMRHVADIKIDSGGGVFIVSASDPGNNGPFKSAFYYGGVMRIGPNKTPELIKPSTFIPLFRFDLQKVEGFEFLPEGGIVFATDNEASEATFFLDR